METNSNELTNKSNKTYGHGQSEKVFA